MPQRRELVDRASSMLGVFGTIRNTKETVRNNVLSSQSKPYDSLAQDDDEIIGMGMVYTMNQIPGLSQQIAKTVGFTIPQDIINDPEANTEIRKGVTKAQALGTGNPPLLNSQEEKLFNALLQHLGPELRQGKPKLTVTLRDGQPQWVLQIGSRTFESEHLAPAIKLFAKSGDQYVESTSTLERRRRTVQENRYKVNKLADPIERMREEQAKTARSRALKEMQTPKEPEKTQQQVDR
jgi:hypothetical protein